MTHPKPARLDQDPQLVDGVDVDALATAVRSCSGVDDLDGGQLGSVATYLPGRKVPGVRVQAGRVTVQVRSRWGVPIAEAGAQIRAALAPVIAGRVLNLVVSDIADPPGQAPMKAAQQPAALVPAPAVQDVEPLSWTIDDDVCGGTSSAPTTPTAAGTTTSSSPAWPPSIRTHLPG